MSSGHGIDPADNAVVTASFQTAHTPTNWLQAAPRVGHSYANHTLTVSQGYQSHSHETKLSSPLRESSPPSEHLRLTANGTPRPFASRTSWRSGGTVTAFMGGFDLHRLGHQPRGPVCRRDHRCGLTVASETTTALTTASDAITQFDCARFMKVQGQ